ncbi:unnamed protein product [Arctia plantaginis]|uniref:G-protein coupled receptors family 1 profile domain-containing protein n=1 Tax=Arctia plantaginis TaxID=874455 RepID=A0A8S1B5M1_ARCPL|nr:unnamed protein product [Arctia plantaginis]CAB3253709.1 unnamed protein product [Arctia plantaginis]
MFEGSVPTYVDSDSDKNFWDYFNMEVSNSEVNVTDIANVVPAPEQGFVIGVYSALLATGALGNIGVFTSLMRSRRRKSRVNLLMTHLVLADMIVTFIVIPLEVRSFVNSYPVIIIILKIFSGSKIDDN